jgi:hypothetical protein
MMFSRFFSSVSLFLTRFGAYAENARYFGVDVALRRQTGHVAGFLVGRARCGGTDHSVEEVGYRAVQVLPGGFFDQLQQCEVSFLPQVRFLSSRAPQIFPGAVADSACVLVGNAIQSLFGDSHHVFFLSDYIIQEVQATLPSAQSREPLKIFFQVEAEPINSVSISAMHRKIS